MKTNLNIQNMMRHSHFIVTLFVLITFGIGQMWGAEGDELYNSGNFHTGSNVAYTMNGTLTKGGKTWTMSSYQINSSTFYLGCNSSNSTKGILAGTTDANPNHDGAWDDVVAALRSASTGYNVEYATWHAYAMSMTEDYSNVGKITVSWAGAAGPGFAYLFADTGSGLVKLTSSAVPNGSTTPGSLEYSNTDPGGIDISQVVFVYRGGSTEEAGSTNKTIRVSSIVIKEGKASGPALYTVTFDANGGSVSPSSVTQASSGAAVALPTPTKSGFKCTGWYTATSGGTKRGNAGGSYTPTASETVHAQWEAVTYSNYRTLCCTDWSTPTVTYSSSLAIGGTANVSIGSGTTHGAVTYESSDEDVLTVTSDGTVTAVGAGTAHIIATWAGDATYCEKSANSNDITVSGIMVAGSIPVNFGQVYQNAVVANKTISVTGINLANAITPSLPGGSPFSFSPASLAKDCSGATLTISANTATIGDYSHALTLTSGSFSTTVTVNMTVIAMPTATFTDALHGLTEDEDGVSLSSYNLTAAQGTAVVFPTLADQSKSSGTCEGEYYIFVGWTEGDNNTDPEAHLVTSYTLANGDAKHYYAVWADASGSATYTKLTTDAVNTSKNYVIGAESGGDTYYLYEYRTKWGGVSTSEDPIVFTVSGTASALKIKDGSNNYIEPCSSKTFTTTTTAVEVALDDDGTIHNTGTYSAWNLRFNPPAGTQGLRWYDGTTGSSAYLYEVGAAGTVHYRTSCCANKVDAPVVTATAVTSTSITLTWPSDVKATGWQIEWNGAGGWVTPSGSCTHTVSGLTPNTTYTWRVRATYEDPVCGADVRSGSTTTNQVYHVTYAKGSGTGTCTAEGSTTDATGYEAGATVTLQSNGFSLSGHVFNAWTEDDPDVTISNNQFTMPDHDVVITASWTAKVDKYFDRMHDQTDALHGGVVETEGTNEGKYYIAKTGCNYSIPTAIDSSTGDACQTSHYKLQGWIAASYMKGYPDHMTGEIGTGNEVHIFPPTGTKTATGATYYAIWAEVTE